MTRTWTLAAVMACALLGAWLLNGPGRAASRAQYPARAAAAVHDPAFADVGRSAAHLRAHLAAPPPLSGSRRNPFLFRDVAPGPAAARRSTVVHARDAATRRARPAMQLIGIARDGEDGNLVRVAMISVLDQLFFVKEGESVLWRYKVTRVSEDAVQLQDGDETFTLALR